jgi:hypothetical protein
VTTVILINKAVNNNDFKFFMLNIFSDNFY